MESIIFRAAIPDTASAIKIAGDAAEGGRLQLDIPGTELAALLQLAAYARGKALKITVTVTDA